MSTRNPVSREKLIRSKREYVWLSSGTHPMNPFLSFKPFYNLVASYYLLCMNVFDERCQQKGKTLEEFLTAAMRGMKMAATRTDYYERHIYMTLFKKAENVLREKYVLKPVMDIFTESKREKKFEELIGKTFAGILKEYAHTIPPSEPSDEPRFNKIYAWRWFGTYEKIIADLNRNNYKEKALQLDELGAVNSKNHLIDALYYNATKLFIPYDKQLAVSYFMKYLHAVADHEKKGLPKTFYKKLFETEKQVQTFETIADNLRSKKKLDVALAEVPLIWNKPYTKIELDKATISVVIEKHSRTVAVLNKILEEDEVPVILTPKSQTPALLNETQMNLLLLFEKNDFTLTMEKVNKYVKGKNILREQLIESINDCCYEILDDVLIEATDDNYEIFDKYYRKVMTTK